jgi:glutamate synthase (NADPH/NADH) large chain
MSGGIAYLVDEKQVASSRCNREMVSLMSLEDPAEIEFVKDMISRHAEHTGSKRAAAILESWEEFVPAIVRVMPNDYRRVMEANGTSELGMTAFQLNAGEVARAAGN